MTRNSRWRRREVQRIAVLGSLLAMAGWVVWSGSGGFNRERQMTARPRLVSIQPLPDPLSAMNGAMCEYLPASATPSLVLALQEARAVRQSVPSDAAREAASRRLPVRTMRDPYSAYSAVAVDPTNDEVVMTDENLFSILSYNRTDNTPPAARMTEPKRIIRGETTDIEFQCSLYVDPVNGDIYAANNDTLGKLVIFSRQARGDVAPDRSINTPHTTFGIAVDEKTQELMLTIQDDAAVVTYSKTARDDEPPIRAAARGKDPSRRSARHCARQEQRPALCQQLGYGQCSPSAAGRGQGRNTRPGQRASQLAHRPELHHPGFGHREPAPPSPYIRETRAGMSLRCASSKVPRRS